MVTVVLMLLWQAAGCSPYQLQGVVVRSDESTVNAMRWDGNPDTLPGATIAGVNVEVVFEPRTTRPRKLGTVLTDDQGRFAMTIDESGAGFMEFEVMVVARQPGYRPSWRIMRLPARGEHVVIQMAPGRDEGGPPVDMLEETLRMRRMLEGN